MIPGVLEGDTRTERLLHPLIAVHKTIWGIHLPRKPRLGRRRQATATAVRDLRARACRAALQPNPGKATTGRRSMCLICSRMPASASPWMEARTPHGLQHVCKGHRQGRSGRRLRMCTRCGRAGRPRTSMPPLLSASSCATTSTSAISRMWAACPLTSSRSASVRCRMSASACQAPRDHQFPDA